MHLEYDQFRNIILSRQNFLEQTQGPKRKIIGDYDAFIVCYSSSEDKIHFNSIAILGCDNQQKTLLKQQQGTNDIHNTEFVGHAFVFLLCARLITYLCRLSLGRLRRQFNGRILIKKQSHIRQIPQYQTQSDNGLSLKCVQIMASKSA